MVQIIVNMNFSNELRVIISVTVTDLPGDPLRRHTTLGELFSNHCLEARPLSQVVSTSGYDSITVSDGFDSDKPINRWFIYDFNVKDAKSQDELLRVPHQVYRARKYDNKWKFELQEKWIEAAKTRCKGYVWGGRNEQARLRALKDLLSREGTGQEVA